MRKVAIVGSAPSSWHLAPFHDESWEIWGMNGMHDSVPRWDRWFHLHTPEFILPPEVEWMKAQSADKPIYTVAGADDAPAVLPFPVDEITQKFGRYFTNSVSFLIAMALHEGVDVIGIYGVDMAQTGEYGSQRPSCEYFIGLARGMGVEVVIPDQSELLKAAYLYGFETVSDVSRKFNVRNQEIKGRLQLLEQEIADKQKEQFYLMGAQENMDYVIKNWRLDG